MKKYISTNNSDAKNDCLVYKFVCQVEQSVQYTFPGFMFERARPFFAKGTAVEKSMP